MSPPVDFCPRMPHSVIVDTAENAVWQMAQHALFIARLDELRTKARRRGLPEKLIGLMGVELCAQCGDPKLIGPDFDVRTVECEEHR